MSNSYVDSDGKKLLAVAAIPFDSSAGHGTVLSVAPLLDTNAYTSGDCLSTAVMEFTNAVPSTGGKGVIKKLLVIDGDVQSAAGELWLFSATVTPAAANAAHAITDAHALLCVGVIPFGTYFASSNNSVSVSAALSFPFTVAGTSLFGIAVTRSNPTYTAAGLTFKLLVEPA